MMTWFCQTRIKEFEGEVPYDSVTGRSECKNCAAGVKVEDVQMLGGPSPVTQYGQYGACKNRPGREFLYKLRRLVFADYRVQARELLRAGRKPAGPIQLIEHDDWEVIDPMTGRATLVHTCGWKQGWL